MKFGGYFIVEDGICHHGLEMGPKPGPLEAVEAFVNENEGFEIDRSRESFFITWNLKGFLKRRPQPETVELDKVSPLSQKIKETSGMGVFWEGIIKPILETIRANTIVEVGAWKGQNTAHLLSYCSEYQGYLHVIDPLPRFEPEAYRQRFGPIFSIHQDLSLNVLQKLGQFDAILLDGDHNWYTVFNELQQIEQTHRNNLHAYPIIFLHDTSQPFDRQDMYYHPETIPAAYRHNYLKWDGQSGQSASAPKDSHDGYYYYSTYEGGAKNGVLTAVEDFIAQSVIEFEFISIPANHGLGILVTAARLQREPQLRQRLDELIDVNFQMSLVTNPTKTLTSQNSMRYSVNLRSTLHKNFEVDRPQETSRPKPKLSIIVVLYNMRREAEKTLHALSAQYQQEVDEDSYEVIVVENGSTHPLENTDLTRFGRNFRYHYLDNAPKSPVRAINLGAAMAQGDYLGIMIDGAYLLTPGVVKYAQLAFQLFQNPVAAVKYYYLGPGQQNDTIQQGYTQMVEDGLLNHISWPYDGYRLFEIGELIAKMGWFHPLFESNCLFVKRAVFDELGGYDEKFDLPAGGYANADFFVRAVSYPGAAPVVILGEAIFHQLHGGTTTNVSFLDNYQLNVQFLKQYQAIRGQKFLIPDALMHYLGHMPPPALLASLTEGGDHHYGLFIKEINTKEEEINRLAAICAEREALINQLSAICVEREALINQLSTICTEREALINQLSTICAEQETLIKSPPFQPASFSPGTNWNGGTQTSVRLVWRRLKSALRSFRIGFLPSTGQKGETNDPNLPG